MVLWAAVLCTEGLVYVGVFRVERVGGIGTDGGLDAGDFLAEGCFGVSEGRGRYVQNPVVDDARHSSGDLFPTTQLAV